MYYPTMRIKDSQAADSGTAEKGVGEPRTMYVAPVLTSLGNVNRLVAGTGNFAPDGQAGTGNIED